MSATESFFVYKKDGKDHGFLTGKDPTHVHKADKFTAVVFNDRTNLRDGLRELVKTKKARIVKTPRLEAVAVERIHLFTLMAFNNGTNKKNS